MLYSTVATTISPKNASTSSLRTARTAAPPATSSQPMTGNCAARIISVRLNFPQKSASGELKSVNRSRNCSAKTR